MRYQIQDGVLAITRGMLTILRIGRRLLRMVEAAILWCLLSVFAIGLLAPRILPALAQFHVAQSGEPGKIEIYEHYNTYTLDAPPPDMRPIALQVPEKFRYGSSTGATRNWGLNLLTYYPSFTSPADPENAKFGLINQFISNWTLLKG